MFRDKFIWYNYGILLESQELLDSAIVIYEQAELLDSAFDLLQYRMAKVNVELKNDVKAEQYFNKLLKLNPTFEVAYIDFGKMLLKNNQVKVANEMLRQGLIQFPDNLEIQKLYKESK